MPLKDLVRARFKSAIQSIPPGTWKVLVTDAHSQKLLDTVLTEYEILQMNVTSVDQLHSARMPETLDAIYLLTPTAQNVDRVIADFAGGRRTYKSAHLYFIDAINDRLAQRLTNELGAAAVLKAFVELFCNFWPLEDRVFSMKTPSAFFSMYGTLGGAIGSDFAMEAFHDDVMVTGRTILNVLTTLNENPYIRYYQPTHHAPLGPLGANTTSPAHSQQQQQQASGQSMRWRSAMGGSKAAEPVGEHLSKRLATQVQKDLDEYMEGNPDFPTKSDRPRSVLFVVDRSMDPCAPFLHEFWYQAMANDLLTIEGGQRYKYTYESKAGGKETREAILSEDDKIWLLIRHWHMTDVIERLTADFKKFLQENAGMMGNSGNVQVNDLKDMLASLPQYQEQTDQYSLHLGMADDCMKIFEKHRLYLAAEVEQCCATGFTTEGKTPKTIVEQMVPLLDDRNISNLDKVRIIALYILFREGVADEDRRRLYQHARLSITEQDMINNLVHIGAQVIKDTTKRFRGSRIKNKYVEVDDKFALSRYKPVVQIMVEEHHSNKLDQHLFPYVRDAPVDPGSALRHGHSPAPSQQAGASLRSARPTWHKAASARANNENRQRYIIFVAGGLTYSEIRQAYMLGEALGKDIYIGTTHVITPESFLKDIKSLGRGGIGGNAPNAIRLHPGNPGRPQWRDPGEPMPYQSILDLRHWEPPVGPPQLGPPPGQQQQQPQARPKKHPKNDLGGFSDLSISSKDSKGTKPEKEKKKRNLFKMRWD